jgi:oligoendopeptidase F
MPTRSPRTAAKRAAKPKPQADLEALPEWNLADLYAGLEAPEIHHDLDRADADSRSFETDFKGRLAELAGEADGGKQLAEAVRRYEVIEDLMGRLISYVGLVYATDTTDPVNTKFYGDVQERITAASLPRGIGNAPGAVWGIPPHRIRAFSL